MRLIEMENRIKELIAINIEDPNVYDAIYDLVYYFFKRKKLIKEEQDCIEISHIGATDLYMRAYTGNGIFSWIGYLSTAYMAYIRQYRKMYYSEVIDATNNPDLADAVIMMSASASIQNVCDFDTVTNLQYIENYMIRTINEVLDKSIYLEYTKDYYDAKLSILLSIISNRFVNIGDKRNRNYVHILYIIVKDEIIDNIGNGNYNSCESLRQFTLEMSGLFDEEYVYDYEF